MTRVEVFYADETLAAQMAKDAEDAGCFHEAAHTTPGWYWWYCQSGCLPDSEANGPFASEDEALYNVQQENDDDFAS